MRRLCFSLFILVVILGCSDKSKSTVTQSPASQNPVAQYGDAMVSSYHKGKQAGAEGDLEAVRKAVDAYHATNDKYPQTLDEVQPLIGSAVDFSKYDYNPQNGSVNLKAN